MTTLRYARLRRGPAPPDSGAAEVPDNGMCLSVFLVLESPRRPGSVLLGKVNPKSPWWEIGAVDPKRLSAIGEHWMLPSCQLKLFESPDDAARRVLKDQLETGAIELTGPKVFSDPSERPGGPGSDPHWDFHFVYHGHWISDTPPVASPWTRLEFVEVTQMSRKDIARSQGDVLELAGFRPKD
jgi:hypothetical protein